MISQNLKIGINDLATTNPELADEWHPVKNGELRPCNVTRGSTTKVWWLGRCGHEWAATPNDRTNSSKQPRGCPYCSGNKVLAGFNDLQTTNPILAAEWHPIKNGHLKPTDVTAGSTKKVWWLGACGHEWQAGVGSRNKGRKCPYCSNSIVLAGFNDLSTTNPLLAKEWHPTKNGELKPQDVIGGTHKKIWWMCDKGHEWQATCNSRNDSGRGCPICAKNKSTKAKIKGLINSKGSLFDRNPQLASEWHPTLNGSLTPLDVMAGSDKKVWWLGKCGHEWEAIIKDRNRGIGCPVCSNLQVLKGFNDLETKRPDLAVEWHPTKNGALMPWNVTPGYSKKVWWKCKRCGHEWQAKVITRNNGRGCSKCSSELNTSYPEQAFFFYLRQIFPDAVNRYIELGKEIDVFIPEINVGIEYDGFRYHNESTYETEKRKDEFFEQHNITVFHIRESKLYDSTKDNTITYRISSSYSTLDKAILDLLKLLEKHYGIKTDLIINNKNDMSRILANYLSYEKDNSILKKSPKLLSEWDYKKNEDLNPELIGIHSNKKVWWKCRLGHEWQATIYSRNKGTNCPYCSNKKVLAGYNDLETKNPTLAEEWNYNKNIGLTPRDVQPGSNKKVWWICKNCGHEWYALISNRNNGAGCPECARKNRQNNNEKRDINSI